MLAQNAALNGEDAGLCKAEYIADHLHQRFLILRREHQVTHPDNVDLWWEMYHCAAGGKRVLDEIRAERKRLAAPVFVDEERK